MNRVVVILALTLVGLAPGQRPIAATDDVWVRPVPGALVAPFDPPRAPWAPGHRGVDLLAAPGTPVLAAGGGVVTFAGEVAGTRHVVVRHANGLRTGYSFLADFTVHAGMVVGRGALLGHSGGTADAAHDARSLHFSLRAGTQYRDPMVLFRPIDLSAVVHLAPV